MTSNLLCRVCLCTDKILREMDEELSEYFEEMCDYDSGVAKLQICSVCEESLRDNLNFTNKCRKANRILQGWRKNKSQNKIGIESLHELLVRWTDINTEPKYKLNHEEDHLNIESINADRCTYDITNTDNVIKQETNYNDDSNFYEVNVMFNDDFKSSENLSDGSQLHTTHVKDDDNVYCDYEVLEVDFLESKESEPVDVNVENLGSKTENLNSIEKPLGKLHKGIKPFAKYESVFDIHLFKSEREVREEVLRRRTSEPYLTADYRCEVCYMVFKYEKVLKLHMKWHDPSAGTFECSACHMRYPTRRGLNNHKQHSHRAKFSCKICPLSTYYKSVMTNHFLKHKDGEEVHSCHCDPSKVFKSLNEFLSHKRSAHAHVCVTCARPFASEGGLLVHRIVMHQTKSLVDSDVTTAVRCEPCGLTFASQQVYTVHVLNTDAHKDIAKDIIACSTCGLSFAAMEQVYEHARSEHRKTQNKKHSQAKPSDICECRVCGISGSGLRWLYQHHRREHPQLRYEPPVKREHLCDQCGKSFLGSSQLREHARTHTGARPFRCEQCGKGFRIKQFLVDHMVWHAPPSRECSECGKKYHSKAGLYNHMRGHIGDRRFKCESCGAGFLSPAMMREHVRGVHLRVRRQRTRHAEITRKASSRDK